MSIGWFQPFFSLACIRPNVTYLGSASHDKAATTERRDGSLVTHTRDTRDIVAGVQDYCQIQGTPDLILEFRIFLSGAPRITCYMTSVLM
ncbi:hypothetical protein DO021_14945 [Desulfobacter hydrogenophilus]|uniref:Uncharacterized protein n=1 Tax=Desulfobacter hydrogenophilus TaxID=2291 RepID=A0A328FC14_9BACT|nr:hypothetical protein [Desulfobacter hydrogenophilus]QBH12260.1 hypothetical protein EYB58_04580 [Desulfobacter hydrogenophilus]RAM01230.1 hypothetical protein DO021_14945 [Desulfobacter hydrogenophilus]